MSDFGRTQVSVKLSYTIVGKMHKSNAKQKSLFF